MLDLGTEFGARAARRLGEEIVAWLTTVREDGMPVPVPVWFLWDGESALIYSQPNTGKLRNLAHSPKASLHLNATHDGGDVIVLVGEARVDAAAPRADHVPEYVAKYREEIAALPAELEPWSLDYSVPIRFVPTRVTGF